MARAYTHKPLAIEIDGSEYKVGPMGMGDIIAEGEAMAEQAWYDEIRKMADIMKADERVEFFAKQMKIKPDFQDKALDLIANTAGMVRIVQRSIEIFNDLDTDEAIEVMRKAEAEHGAEITLRFAETVFDGLFSLKEDKKKAPRKRKAKPKRKK